MWSGLDIICRTSERGFVYIVYTSLNCVKHRLCKYLIYIMTDTDKRLIKDRPDHSSDSSVTALARPAATVNYRPVLSSERALRNNKQQLSKRKSQRERKIGRGSQMGT
jgi:hypothetical protein